MSFEVGSGLQNLGNTCFFNAALQPILHTPAMMKLFAHKIHSTNCTKKNKNQWCVFCEMEFIYLNSRRTKSFAPHNMINHLKLIFKKFKLGRQEDSHQFLRYLIEGMQEAETGKLGKDRQTNEKIIRGTKIFDIFGGIIKTCVECMSCHGKSITTERYYDMNIECQRSNSLNEGLLNFFAVDNLVGDNKYLCERCHLRANAKKRFYLETIPDVMTFQLKRFTNLLRKIGKFIEFPRTFNAGKFLEHPRKVIMKLYGIIVHAGGTSDSGHYFAFVRVGDSWFKMDDSYVSKCQQESVLRQNAYILFYQKIEEQFECKSPKSPEKMQEEKKDRLSSLSVQKMKEESKSKEELKLNGFSKQKQKMVDNHKEIQENHVQEKEKQNEEEDDFAKLIPKLKLRRTKSKEQAEQQAPLAQLVFQYAQKMMQLQSKLKRNKPRNRSMRHVQELRQYEMVMTTRRRRF